MKKFLGITILAIFMGGCQDLPDDQVAVGVRDQKIVVEIAKTPEAMATGLMYRDNLEQEHGMLFAFEDEKRRHFWMKNVRFPLTAVFISADKKIVDIQKMNICQKDPCQVYDSMAPAQYVLEVNPKDFAGRIGDEVEF